eukprot:g7516.t1.1.5e17418a g7516  g7516.t1 contig24:803404-803752(-)
MYKPAAVLSLVLLASGITSTTALHNIVGCGEFKTSDYCLPAVECYWCEKGDDTSSQSTSGECMEFDTWIASCPRADLASV